MVESLEAVGIFAEGSSRRVAWKLKLKEEIASLAWGQDTALKHMRV